MNARAELIRNQAIGYLKQPITDDTLKKAAQCIVLLDNALNQAKIKPKIVSASYLLKRGGDGYTRNLILFGLLWQEVVESYRGTEIIPPTSFEFQNTLKALGYQQLLDAKGIVKKINYKGGWLQTVWVIETLQAKFNTLGKIKKELNL